MYDSPRFLNAGDTAFVVELGDSISPECNRKVHTLVKALDSREIPGIVDIVPTYRSLLVQYDPLRVGLKDLKGIVLELEKTIDEGHTIKPRIVKVPTLYGGDHGPDMQFVAENAGVTPEEVIKIHSETDYLVYMMGFTPGFPYLGGLSKKLVTPRLKTPRTKIPAGSVGIAESQTGVYPQESPGGWRLIGRTPLRLFDPRRAPPSLISAGDIVRFTPITQVEYDSLHETVKKGEFQVSSVVSEQ
ncbi:MAG: 5-oxoprolinase subunit PxpB [SAR202 cluster bacterium]|nr:5-oxoprolinase subunit PxpB [SAR202 cluster bacterium]